MSTSRRFDLDTASAERPASPSSIEQIEKEGQSSFSLTCSG
jgi:hypothetical protein